MTASRATGCWCALNPQNSYKFNTWRLNRSDMSFNTTVNYNLFNSGQDVQKVRVAFVPSGPDGDAVVRSLAELTEQGAGHVLLNERIAQAFDTITYEKGESVLAISGTIIE